jgi:hypothetical protein
MREHTRDTWFYLEVRIHKESCILVEEFTKNQISLNPFLSQEVTNIDLELLTTTTMGNTNFPRLTRETGSSRATSNHLGAKLQE